MDAKQFGSSRPSAELRLHEFERRLKRESELQFQYHNFMKEYEDLGHMEPMNSQEGTKHATVKQSSSLQVNKFHDNARITTESNNW